MVVTEVYTSDKKKKGQSKVLALIGIFILLYLINCTFMYFYLKHNNDKKLAELRAAANSIQVIKADSTGENSVDQSILIDSSTADSVIEKTSETIMTDKLDTEIAESNIQIIEDDSVVDSGLSEDYNQKVRKYVNIVDKMKPKDTATVFARLDDEFVVQVLMRMKERNAAKVMSEMPPARAARLSKMIMDKTDS